ncbi:MAG: formate--tetrahydrofolate ligase [Geminicoccaceae bacterium]|nr:formate--tetrahydrofolate ligase [Geminicoccaceae bacterium]MDW8369362.1 formate--tetrahydrofolate ligase [Geminicoccaceae bacterium]
MAEPTSDIEIARAARPRPIAEVAAELGIPEHALTAYGRHVAKVDLGWIAGLEGRPRGRLVLVTAVTPTPAGEGKTTTTIGLGDALRRLGKRTAICLREPSLGPCFGAKGGATGGGRAQVVPMERINLHFTGDFHAVGAAHNLLAAMVDNHLHWGNELGLDPRRILWRRVLDTNDRALRRIVVGLGGPADGVPREDGFDITPASEVMAVLCLARDLLDLEARLARMLVGLTRDRVPVTAARLEAHGAMAVLLLDALAPNLVQTLEGTPAFVHGGPFANIAHGCNSVLATRTALATAEVVVTEAGFGADLGAEKFVDIKSRASGLYPEAAVLVASIRALRHHGGVAREALARPDRAAVARGIANLDRHVRILRRLGLPTVVALNVFAGDSAEEFSFVQAHCRDRLGVEAVLCSHWAHGGAGALELAQKVAALLDEHRAAGARLLYDDATALVEKLRTVATEIYGAADILLEKAASVRLAELEGAGFGRLPVCIAKTPYSFAADPNLSAAPSSHVLPIRDIRVSAGAGFVVAICGEIATMPGLPRRPAATRIRLDAEGRIEGLA